MINYRAISGDDFRIPSLTGRAGGIDQNESTANVRHTGNFIIRNVRVVARVDNDRMIFYYLDKRPFSIIIR